MNKFEIIKSFYESNMGKGLPDYEIQGWESEEAQKLRFDIMVSNMDLEGKKLLDVGCGLGNLLEYLNFKGIKVDYTGVDILESMIESAEEKKLAASFYCVDVFKKSPFEKGFFDVVYTSGIFNLNLGNNREFFSESLYKLCDLGKEVLVFNLLHASSPDRDDTYFYFSPEEVIEIIEKGDYGISEVKIVENYLRNDFTTICKLSKL